jgi:hypothetical protein
MAAHLGQRDVARGFVTGWLEHHPDDREFRSLLQNFDQILDEEFGIVPDSAGTRTGDQE